MGTDSPSVHAPGRERSAVPDDVRPARQDGRAVDELRPVRFERDYTVMAPGSVLVDLRRRPRCCAPPRSRNGSRRGCAGAARAGSRPSTRCCRARHPSAPPARPPRGSSRGAPRRSSASSPARCGPCATWWRSARCRSRSTVTPSRPTGARTASICGAYVALHDACTRLVQTGTIRTNPLTDSVAAVSVGIIDGVPMLDLPYVEDSRAEVDMNVVMTGAGRFVEVQGTAEGMAFSRSELDSLLGLAEAGIKELTGLQSAVLAAPPPARR